MALNIDALPHNADWTKQTWDLPTDKEGILRVIESSGMTLTEFLELPAAKAIPEELLYELSDNIPKQSVIDSLSQIAGVLEALLHKNDGPQWMPDGTEAKTAQELAAILNISDKGAQLILENKLRFVRTPAGAARFHAPIGAPIGRSVAAIGDAIGSAIGHGGFTFETHDGKLMNKGCAVSPYPQWTKSTPLTEFSVNHIRDFHDAHRAELAKPNHYIGAWTHEGNVYQDITVVVDDPKEADRIALENDQYSWFDLATQTEHIINSDATSGGALQGKAIEIVPTKHLIDMSTVTDSQLEDIVRQLRGE